MSALPELPFEDERAAAEADALRLIEEAEVLGIPWRQVLKREILAEGMLQRFLGSPIPDLPLWQALSVIPNSLFHSWRVRDLLDSLCHDAAAECSQSARRELAYLLECLSGPRARRMSERAVLSRHYRFAYDRVLELQAVALAAERCRAGGAARVQEVVEATGCGRADAEWALARASSPTRGHALDDAVSRVREEGFEIPVAPTELKAFSRLKRLVSRHRPLRRLLSRAREGSGRAHRTHPRGDDLQKTRDEPA
jgi:hypothetical protein